MLSTRSPVEHGQRVASYDTSLVVSGGVDCRRRRRNFYDKKPQRYAKDNRTAHLTARSEKSVAYVTNNNRLYSTFCTVEANYWQTRSIARPFCDSRATCYVYASLDWREMFSSLDVSVRPLCKHITVVWQAACMMYLHSILGLSIKVLVCMWVGSKLTGLEQDYTQLKSRDHRPHTPN